VEGLWVQAQSQKSSPEVYIMAENVLLACSECKRRNYATEKNKKKSKDRLELKKFCSGCRKHTVHREIR